MKLDTLFAPIQEDLRIVQARLREALQVDFAPLAAILGMVEMGGKRIRPALTMLASKFHSGDPEKVRTLAVAVELIHAATLIHDDFIDKSPLRRGVPTISSKWSGTAAVLAGDYLLAHAAEIAATIEDFRVMRLFARALKIICEGEIRQDLSKAPWPPRTEDYYRHIESKTAALFRASMEGGAILSGAPENWIAALKEYGHNFGMAFQIADDILDFTADEGVLGKPVGSDLRQGTLTLPVLYFIEQSDGGARVREIMQRDGRSGVEMDALIASIRASPAVQAARATARDFARVAQDALAILPRNEYRDALHAAAMYVVERPA